MAHLYFVVVAELAAVVLEVKESEWGWAGVVASALFGGEGG